MRQKPITILIVEDEKIIAIDLKKTLEKLDYYVINIISSGEETLEFVKRNSPDLILMDIMLDGKLTGIETSQLIKLQKDIPVVFLSALTDHQTLQKAKITEPYGYIPKPFEQKILHSVIQMAVYKHKAEMMLREKTRELEEEKRKTDQLLLNILPAEIVQELKTKGFVAPRLYEKTTIMFSHFNDFSNITTKFPPEFLVGELNEMFHQFDLIVEQHDLEKLKTIGDTYMIGGGLPKESKNHAEQIVRAAIEMHSYIDERNKNSKLKWEIRTGVNTGKVVAGIVGQHKYTYDVWGDAVNIASRMETSSEPGRINISEDTFNLVKHFVDCEYRGKLIAKGRGQIDMYFVNGLK